MPKYSDKWNIFDLFRAPANGRDRKVSDSPWRIMITNVQNSIKMCLYLIIFCNFVA